MTDLTKLRELQEQASPGPWTHHDLLVETENTEIRLASEYDAQLAALATHLLPLAEALEAAQAQIHGEFCRVSTIAPGHSKHCSNATAKLKKLQEALDG